MALYFINVLYHNYATKAEKVNVLLNYEDLFVYCNIMIIYWLKHRVICLCVLIYKLADSIFNNGSKIMF